MGFERTPEQCRVRIKSLKRQFLLTKEGNLRNNGQYHKIFKFSDTMERILSNRPALDPQEFIEGSAGGEEAGDGMEEEDGEDARDVYAQHKGECPCPAETEVKLERLTVPIPVPVTVTAGHSSKCALLLLHPLLCDSRAFAGARPVNRVSETVSISPLQALPLDRAAAASRPIVCLPRRLNGRGSGEQTPPRTDSWSSFWNRAHGLRTISTEWRSSACRQRSGAGRPSTWASCTCSRCSARCSPACPPWDRPSAFPKRPLLLLLLLKSSTEPPPHAHAHALTKSVAAGPQKTVLPSGVHS